MKKIFFLTSLVLNTLIITAQNNWIPNGAITEIQGNTLIINTDGWSYIGTNLNGQIIDITAANTKTVSCTCKNSSGNCNPFSGQGPGGSTAGCAGSCKSCDMKQSGYVDNSEIEFLSGGYYNSNSLTRIILDGEKVPAIFPELIESQIFVTKYNEFISEIYGQNPIPNSIINSNGELTAPEGYSIIGIMILGRGLLTILPNEYVNSQLGYICTAKASCACTAGGCSLKSNSIPLIGSVTYCEGNCTGTCTLTTTKININDGHDYHIEIETFKY
jgi:hypothetical protein